MSTKIVTKIEAWAEFVKEHDLKCNNPLGAMVLYGPLMRLMNPDPSEGFTPEEKEEIRILVNEELTKFEEGAPIDDNVIAKTLGIERKTLSQTKQFRRIVDDNPMVQLNDAVPASRVKRIAHQHSLN